MIAAVPPTVMAAAAFRKSGVVSRKMATSNGHTAGQMIEASYELTKAVSHRQDEMAKALEMHVLDVDSHCKEQTQYYKDHNGILQPTTTLKQETSQD